MSKILLNIFALLFFLICSMLHSENIPMRKCVTCLSAVLDGIPNDFATSKYIFLSNSSGRVSKNCEVSSFLDGGVPASDGRN